MSEDRNFFELSGILQSLEKLRWTPSGVALRVGSVHHVSTVMEEGCPIRLSFCVPFKALGETATFFEETLLGQKLWLSGFLVYPRNRSTISTVELRVSLVKFEEKSIESI